MTNQPIRHRDTGAILLDGLSIQEVVARHRAWLEGQAHGTRAEDRLSTARQERDTALQTAARLTLERDTTRQAVEAVREAVTWWREKIIACDAVTGEDAEGIMENFESILLTLENAYLREALARNK